MAVANVNKDMSVFVAIEMAKIEVLHFYGRKNGLKITKITCSITCKIM
jgi:hypothetical protein